MRTFAKSQHAAVTYFGAWTPPVPSARVNCLRREGELLAELTAADPAVPVPTCPGWSTADVLGHTGGGFRWAIRVVGDRDHVYERDLPDPPAEFEELFRWYHEGLEELTALLTATEADLPCWIPVGRMETVAWWQRKVAVETALHRHDVDSATAQRAGRAVAAIDPTVAGDGIDEFVSDFLPGMLMLAQGAGPSGTVTLAPVDEPRSWSLDLNADMRGVVRQPGEAPAASVLTGTASDLLLWAWNRLPDLDRIGVAGDTAILTDWTILRI